MSHPVVHWEIGGPDREALEGFYEGLFGWKTESQDENYAIVRPGEGLEGGIMRTTAPMPPYVTIYVKVEDLEEALDKACRLGGQRAVPPVEIGNGMAFALFTDPAGNTVGLLRTPAERSV